MGYVIKVWSEWFNSVSRCCNKNACWTGVWESFSPLSRRTSVDLDILPIILKFGTKLETDSHQARQGPRRLHLDELKDVRFLYAFINNGLSSFSIFMDSLLPKFFCKALAMSWVLLVLKIDRGTRNFLSIGSAASCFIDIEPVLFLSNTCFAYSDGEVTTW